MSQTNIDISGLLEVRSKIDALIEAAKQPVEPVTKLPESWAQLEQVRGVYINSDAIIVETVPWPTSNKHRNIWPTRELAEAALAMSQLAQLRAKYWRQADNWEPDWKNVTQSKYAIYTVEGIIVVKKAWVNGQFLTFPTPEQRDHFLKHHRELIETAKPLL